MKLTKEQKDLIRKRLLSNAQKPNGPTWVAKPKQVDSSLHTEEVHNPHFHSHNLKFEQMLRKAGL
jgi:hypothetical protein